MINTQDDSYRSPQVQYGNIVRPDIDFRSPGLIETDFSLLGVGEKFMSGIFQGFTTINLSRREPANVAEGLAVSLGTWLGITGVAFTGPKGWATRLMAQGGSRGIRMATSISQNQFRSVPMWVGDKATKGLTALQNNMATPVMRNFLRSHPLTTDAIEGGVRIGAAMGIVNWQEGIDAMLMGGALGAFFGGSDRVIGNAIRGIRPELIKAIGTSDPARLRQAERAVSMISAGIVSGMPSTLMGQPWEYQVYDYLFGAWLGAEPSYAMRTAHTFVHGMKTAGKENQLMHSKLLKQQPEYRDLMKRNRNKTVRSHIDEEITAQVEFVLGQKINATNKASVLMALAHSANEAGHTTPEQALQLNQLIYQETADGHFLQEGIEKYSAQAQSQGMTEQAATAHAMERIRDDFAEWKMGNTKELSMLREIASDVEVFNQDKSHVLFKPVNVDGEIGIVTRTDTDGRVLQVLASDGIELVTNTRGKTRRITSAEKVKARLQTDNTLPMTRQDFVNKIVAWRYAVDETGALLNQGESSKPLDIDKRMWDVFPDVADQYLSPHLIRNDDGTYTAQVAIGNKDIYTLQGQYSSEKDAFTASLNHLTSNQKMSKLQRDPSLLHNENILGRLAEAYKDMDYDNKSTTLYKVVADILNDLKTNNNIKDGDEIYSTPIELYKKLHSTLVAGRDLNNQRIDLTKELNKAKKDQTTERDQRIAKAEKKLSDLENEFGRQMGWEGFITQMKEQYPMGIGKKNTDYWQQSNPIVRELRKWHNAMSQQVRVKNLAIFRGTKTQMHLRDVDVFPNNQRNIVMKAPSMLQKAVKSIDQAMDVIHIDKAFNMDKMVEDGLSAVDDLTLKQINGMLSKMYDDGDLPHQYYIYSGVKDKDTLRAIPYLFANKKSASSFISKRVKALRKDHTELAEGITNAIKGKGDDFIRQYASNMRMLEKINNDATGDFQYPIQFIASNKKNFITTVAGFNKRMQILDAEGMVLNPEFYKNPDGSQKTEFKGIILNVTNLSSNHPNQAEGVPEFKNRGNKNPDQLADQARDGGVIVDQLTFSQMKADGGLESLSGAIKGVNAFTDSSGAFLGKLAFFRADDNVNKWMNKEGVNFIHNTTTAKQMGKRTAYDLVVAKDMNAELYSDNNIVSNPETFPIPIDGVTINSGQSENPVRAMGKKSIPVQLLQTFSPHVMDVNVARQTINEIMATNNITSDVAMNLLTRIKALEMGKFDSPLSKRAIRDIRNEVSKIDIDDFSTADLFQIMEGGYTYEESGLYDRVIREIYTRKDETINELMSDGKAEDAMEMLNAEYNSALDYMLDVTDISENPITATLLNQRSIKQYTDAIVRNYIVNRTMRPKIDYALKSIGSQQDPFYMQKHNRVEEGTFMLGQAAKNMKIYGFGQDMTLGQAWNMYQDDLTALRSFKAGAGKLKGKKKETSLKRIDEMQDRISEWDNIFEMIVSRVPIEHASGVRALRFKGFSDEIGVTSKLNPRDMENLGGMDIDIDSVFMFQNMGKTFYKAQDGTMKRAIDELKKPEIKDHWYGEDGTFIDPKSEAMKEIWKAKYDDTKNMQDMFNPEKLFQAGRGTANANQALGQVANARRDLLALVQSLPVEKFRISDMNLTKDQKSFLLKTIGDIEIKFRKVANAEEIIDKISRAGINMSADAADLTGFIGKFQIKSMMHSHAYMLDVGKLKKPVSLKDKVKVESILRSNSPAMKLLQDTNQLLSGRYKTENNLNGYEVATQLKRFNSQFNDVTIRSGDNHIDMTGLHGSYYKGLGYLMGADIAYRPLDGYSTDRVKAFYDIIGQFTKKNSNLMTWFRDQVLTPFTGVKRMTDETAYYKFLDQYNDVISKFENQIGSTDILDVRNAVRNVNDMIANDMNDVTSAMVLFKEIVSLTSGPRDITFNGVTKKTTLTPESLSKIFKIATNTKQQIYLFKNPAKFKEQSKHDSIDSILNTWKNYRETLDPQLRRLADYSMISTFFFPRTPKPKEGTKDYIKKSIEWHKKAKWTNHTHQGEVLKLMTPLHVKEFFDMYRGLSTMSERVPTTEINVPVGKGRKDIPLLEAHFRNIIEGETLSDIALEFPYDYYDVKAPERFDMRIDKIKQRSKDRWNKTEDPPSFKDEAHPGYNTFSAQRTRVLKELGDYIKDGNEFKLSAEEQILFKELRDLFAKHPQVSQHFNELFMGEMAYTRRLDIAKEWDKASLDDLRKFIAMMRGSYHGDMMSQSKFKDQLPKWLYWMNPDKYHRQYRDVDMVLDDVIVITKEGKSQTAKVISSPAKRLVNFSNLIQMSKSVRQAQLTEQVNSFIKPLSDGVGKDFDMIWRYTVLKRKVDAGKGSDNDNARYSKYKRDFDRLVTKKYDVDGESLNNVMVSDQINTAITRSNKLAWKMVKNPDQKNYYYDKSKRWVNSDAVTTIMTKSFTDGKYDDLYVPDTWTLNNMILQEHVHKIIRSNLGNKTPIKGSDIWIKEANRIIKNMDMTHALDMPPLPFDMYYPQRNHTKAALEKWQIKKKMTDQVSTAETINQAQYSLMRLYEDQGSMTNLGDDFVLGDLLGLNPKDYNVGEKAIPSHLKHRESPDKQIPDWDPGIKSYYEYLDVLVSSNMNKALALVGKQQIDQHEFRMKQNYKESSKHYADFLRLYLSDQVMNQTMVPKSWIDNYAALNLKGSGYYYFTDRYYTELDQKIGKFFGKNILGENDPMRALRMAELANLEAKYSLITLLSRPKAMAMNLYGGGTILASDVGLTNALKGWRLSEIQRVNPEIKSWDDAIRFAENHGAMESLVRNEVMTSQAWGNSKNRKGLSAMMDAIKADPSIKDMKLMEIAKRHGISDAVMNVAAFPMRYSERMLRTRSFLTHYIRAIDVLEVTGPSAYNHPWVIEMARRGVATTQFMYNNANRPAWTRSNAGKIAARFKMWAIKSVKFRSDAYNEAMADALYNVSDPATQKRLNDVIMMDMFMIALAGLFPFSVFGNSIPEPFSWMNELVKWAFGDPEEKAQAFRGGSGLPTALAPLGIALPPSSRLLTSWIDPIVRDEYSQLTGYTMWTLFPFGLLVRDSRNAIGNPQRGIDTMTGIPVADALGFGYGDISAVRNEAILPSFN